MFYGYIFADKGVRGLQMSQGNKKIRKHGNRYVVQINITWLVQIGNAQEKRFSNYFSSVEIFFHVKLQDIHMGLLILQSIPVGIANIPMGTLEIPEHLKCQSL